MQIRQNAWVKFFHETKASLAVSKNIGKSVVNKVDRLSMRLIDANISREKYIQKKNKNIKIFKCQN